jgi:hypothetical protein
MSNVGQFHDDMLLSPSPLPQGSNPKAARRRGKREQHARDGLSGEWRREALRFPSRVGDCQS